MDNDTNIRYRVITGVTSTRGDPPFLKLIQAFLALSKSLDAGLSPSQCLQYSDLCSEMLSAQHMTQRHVAVQEGCRREVDCYAAKQKGIQKCIAAIELDIAHAEATLLEAQVLRTNLEEYERKREVIMHHTSRAACAVERERVVVDAAAIEAECALADNMVQVHKKQIATMLYVLEMLQKPSSEGLSSGPVTHCKC
ncbi:g8892 [Coccomyxa viridis]|uniref:G8892 protein n=1 Tax=Coccomyxa viridis TaxID=1274662 RepID=A0ABP1G889_9CHLO